MDSVPRLKVDMPFVDVQAENRVISIGTQGKLIVKHIKQDEYLGLIDNDSTLESSDTVVFYATHDELESFANELLKYLARKKQSLQISKVETNL